ncbi:MAG: hypothetical protein K0R54_781 [Clostridiaceae bacterium]|jgi:uncharacterized protein YqeY|nr:hypothetical protein [Clostridiaceae bacterium]
MLLEKLKKDMFQAMKDKDTKKKEFLQVVIGEIETEGKRVKGEFTDSKIEEMLLKMQKRTVDSLVLYSNQGRVDLFQKAKLEIEILKEYLPEQLTEDEITSIIKATIEELNIASINEKGKLMKALMPKVKGKADGKLINQCVEGLLQNK